MTKTTSPDRLDFLADETRLWIDRDGRLYDCPGTHAVAFPDILASLGGNADSPEVAAWCLETLGSVPDTDPDFETEDNPLWEYNEYAIRALFWIRATISRFERHIEIDATYEDGRMNGVQISCLLRILSRARRARNHLPEIRVVFPFLSLSLEEAMDYLREEKERG